MIHETSIKSSVIDPVCGMKINPNSAAASVNHSGHEIFFCANGCKKAFVANPERYLKKKHKRKGLWQRYLDRLNKATGGQTPPCH